ncbi:neural proliferation differentiation and control protein 1-like isoform X1 [Sinocyclocheilus anshuiensis]|uniref:neural proliferation differentiation and control protein 1-like isoform X1 n=1 Tax=Sinocyclocheilus anshuiensis TaxID=1608454 RepID=UPI0007B9E4BC|nr:PREDICTED: neural proliferation differentiation and control protein 1-like isoform X1 [Sinocyclocheilus anshuiensis]
MLFCPSRSARRVRASLLLPGVLICVILAAVGASMPVNKCPNHIDCARKGRHFCKPGSSHCGPCLSPLEEDKAGLCVAPRTHFLQHHHHHQASHPDVDEEIDYLSSVISKQQMSEVKQPDSRSQSPLQSQSESKQKSLHKPPTTSGPSTPTQQTPKSVTNSSDRHGPIISPHSSTDSLLVLMISLCIIVGSMALIIAAVCWVRLQRETHLAQKVDYPAFHAAGPSHNQTSSGDKTLAHSAQMYHYQHQKQQMLSMEKHKAEPKVSESGVTSDEENEVGDFTVYECPGLAPTGEMEVKNPLFDDSTLHSQRNHK